MESKSVIYKLIVFATLFFIAGVARAQDVVSIPSLVQPTVVIETDSTSNALIQTVTQETTTVTTYYTDGTVEERVLAIGESINENGRVISTETDEFDESKLKGIAKGFSHFTWGLETGMIIDLSGLDMSTFNLDVMFGYRNKWIQTLGVGGGIHKSLGSADSFLPVYVLFRTSFRSKPSLCFFHLRLGYSFNTISNSPTYGDTSCAIGCGLHLTRKRNFQSYLLLAYAFRHFNRKHLEISALNRSNVSLAQIGFGISF
ncbi:MAG: hypothetical protein K2H86_04505 [Muribaculaceae bacterium]|nr:hypothetical protein [Muribaculaceae bacterium]